MQDPNRLCREQVSRIEPQEFGVKHVTESVQYLIANLRGGVRKRARGVTSLTTKRKKAKRARVIKRDIFPDLLQSLVFMSDAEVTSVSSDFDILMHRPIQTAVLVYKPLAPVEQNDLEYEKPGDSVTYIDLYIKLTFAAYWS